MSQDEDDEEFFSDDASVVTIALPKQMPTPGRRKGRRNKGTYLIKHAIQGRGKWMVNRLFQLAKRRDGATALGALKLLLAYGYGKPAVVVELAGGNKLPYSIETPPSMDHEQWVRTINVPRVVNPPGHS